MYTLLRWQICNSLTSSTNDRRIREASIQDDLLVEPGRIFGNSRSLRVIEVNVVDSELLRVSSGPFEVIHDGPDSVAYYVTSVDEDSWEHRIEKKKC